MFHLIIENKGISAHLLKQSSKRRRTAQEIKAAKELMMAREENIEQIKEQNQLLREQNIRIKNKNDGLSPLK